jgi:hypothetical protein
MSITELRELIDEYLKWVWSLQFDESRVRFFDEESDKKIELEEYVDKCFRLAAAPLVYGYMGEFDFVDWFLIEYEEEYGAKPKLSLDNILSFPETCEVFSDIMTYYTEKYGNALDYIRDFEWRTHERNILTMFVHVEVYSLEYNELCEILEIDKLTEEDKQRILEKV